MTTYTWTGSSGADWSIAGDWSPAGGPPGIADAADILSGGTVSVGEAQSIDVLSLGAGAMLSIATGAAFTVAGSIDNHGAIFDVGALVVAGPAVTLDGGGVVGLTGTGDTSVVIAAGTEDVLVNVGDTISGGGSLGDGSLGLTNEAGGVIDGFAFFAAPATLDLDVAGMLVNAGLIEATTGALEVSGPVANSGTVEVTGNALALNGGIDNSGLVDAAGGTLDLQGTVVNSGTITVAGGTLDLTGVLVNTSGTIDATAGTADVSGTIQNAGTIQARGGTLKLQGAIANAGTIAATGGTVDLQAGIYNVGMIAATSGILDLTGQVSNAHGTIASVNNGITLDGVTVFGGALAGTIAATNATLDASATPVSGNPITNFDSGTIVVNGSLTVFGSLDNLGITLQPGSVLTLATALSVLSGGASVSLVSRPGSEIGPDPNYPPNPNIHYPIIILPTISTIEPMSVGQMLVNVDDTIDGGGTISEGVSNDTQGVIDADQQDYALNVGGSITNRGLMEATTGGLNLNGSIANYGLMLATSRVLNLTGVIDQSGGGTLEGDGNLATGGWVATTGTVIGGTLAGAIVLGTGTLDGSGDPVTNLGVAEFNSGNINDNDSVVGTVDNIGTLLIAFGNTLVVAAPTVTLTGAGEFGDSGLIMAAATGDLLVNVDNTITVMGTYRIGGGALALDNKSAGLVEGGNGGVVDPLSLTNDGTVDATAGTLTIDTASLTNAGTLQAAGGTLLFATGTFTDLSGTWIADDNTIALPEPDGFAGIAGHVVLTGTAAEFVSSTGTGVPPLTNSYLSPETILAGGVLGVFDGAIFGIERTPGGTIVVGGSTFVGGTLLPFGNAGTVQLGGGTADLVAAVTNTGTMFGNGSLIVSGAVMNNAGGTVEANGGLLIFQGALAGGQLAVDAGATLELSSGWFGGGGAIPLSFDAGNDLLQIDVADNAGSFSSVGTVAVNSFVYGDTIVVHGSVVGGGGFPGFTSVTNDGTTLAFIEGGQTLGTIGFAGGTSHVLLSQDANNDEIITAACFAAGTHILTARGEVPVEALRLGDTLPTLRGGGSGRVRWLGFRDIDCRRHKRPQEVWPIRVQAGAFGPEAPHRDLLLSPDHAVYVDGVLIPVRYLVNGVSIAQVEVSTVGYWHVELDRHEVILAEGMAAESYLDTGNRSAFTNGPRSRGPGLRKRFMQAT